MKTIALFGGSFNPPHAGHAAIIQWLIHVGKYDKVWVLPSVQHAFDKDLLSYEDRADMLHAMCTKDIRNGHHSNVNIVRRDEKYTVDVLEALHQENPDTLFTLILGADVAHEVGQWREWERCCTLARPLFVARQGVQPPSDVEVETISVPEVSSTSIRERLAQGNLEYLCGEGTDSLRSWDGADLTPSVLTIIEKKGYYDYKKPTFPDPTVCLGTVTIPVEGLVSYPPGTPFCLIGNIRQVLTVDLVDDTFVFTVLRDTAMEQSNHDRVRDWLKRQSRCRARNEPFNQTKPRPSSPSLQYLKTDAEPVQGSISGTFLGRAGNYVFWQEDLPRTSGLFGGLFGF